MMRFYIYKSIIAGNRAKINTEFNPKDEFLLHCHEQIYLHHCEKNA